MNTIIIYMIKTALYLGGFYLVYSLLLRRDTAHGRNRAFILLSIIGSAIFPLISFSTPESIDLRLFGKLLSEVTVTAESTEGTVSTGFLNIAIYIYAAGVILFILKTLFDLFNLTWLIARRKQRGSRIIRFRGFNTPAFSAMGYIFINEKISSEEASVIIDHESNHLRKNHYLDIILIELVTAFQWFNPFIYLFDRELRAIHEFQADRGCLDSGISVTSYQNILLSQVFRTGSIRLTNSFSNPSLIRKRMIMMTRKQSSGIAGLKILFVLPVAGFMLLAVSAEVPATPSAEPQASPVQADEVPFSVVEEMPVFPGGDAELLKFISTGTNYPDKAKENGIQGRVIVKFCITSTGNISQVSVLKSIDPELDKEAIRVVSQLPAFKPGRQGGKPVPVWYMVPITFTLK